MPRESTGGMSGALNQLRRLYPGALVASDLVAFVPAFWFAGLLRNELGAIDIRWRSVALVALLSAAVFLLFSWFVHLYRNRYRVATFEEMLILGGTWGVSAGTALILNMLLFTPRVPTSIFAMGMMLAGLSMVLSRTVWRVLRRAEIRPDAGGRTRVLVFGAGDGGTQVVKSMLGDSDSKYVPSGCWTMTQRSAIASSKAFGSSATRIRSQASRIALTCC